MDRLSLGYLRELARVLDKSPSGSKHILYRRLKDDIERKPEKGKKYVTYSLIDDYSLDDLREIAKDISVKRSGSKSELWERVKEHIEMPLYCVDYICYLPSVPSLEDSPRRRSSKNKSRKSSQTDKKPNYFRSSSKLNPFQKKYCRCIAHVTATMSDKCLREKTWKKPYEEIKKSGIKDCRNPFAICTKSTNRRGKFSCFENFDFKKMPREEVRKQALLEGKTVKELLKAQKNLLDSKKL